MAVPKRKMSRSNTRSRRSQWKATATTLTTRVEGGQVTYSRPHQARVVTDALYHRHPDLAEGRLAKLRAAVVNMRALAHVARALGVGDHVLLGKGEEGSGGRDKSSILADTLEALIGAVYVEHGIDVSTAFVHRLVDPLLTSSAALGAGLDWKTSLQELTAELALGVPEYRVSEEGPDHAKTFHADVLVQGEVRGAGSGRSKKEAEQGAAAAAFSVLRQSQPADGLLGAAPTPEP